MQTNDNFITSTPILFDNFGETTNCSRRSRDVFHTWLFLLINQLSFVKKLDIIYERSISRVNENLIHGGYELYIVKI